MDGVLFGHPIGAAIGAKLSVTLMYEMIYTEAKHRLVIICVAIVIGIARIFCNMTLAAL